MIYKPIITIDSGLWGDICALATKTYEERMQDPANRVHLVSGIGIRESDKLKNCTQYAFARFMGWEYELEKMVFDGGIDFTGKAGTYQVKGFTYRQKPLYFRPANRPKADFLVHSDARDLRRIRLIGWITREDFHKYKHKTDLGYTKNNAPPVDAVDDKHLRPMSDLYAIEHGC